MDLFDFVDKSLYETNMKLVLTVDTTIDTVNASCKATRFLCVILGIHLEIFSVRFSIKFNFRICHALVILLRMTP